MAIFANTLHAGEGTLNIAKSLEILVEHGAENLVPLPLVALLVFAGAMGKSAQFPLHVWLPDAMEGPTPVSALIHAATMVNAGVYLVARANPLFAAAPDAMVVVAAIGIFTAILAASIAFTQTDIKRVLAYSTLSQLGYMFAALGVGAFAAAIFHLMTHGFFKGLLFLGSGSVIHAVHDEQDMNRMGGLWKKIPITHATMLIGTHRDRRDPAPRRLLLEGRDPRRELQVRLLLGLGDRLPRRRDDRLLHVAPDGQDLLRGAVGVREVDLEQDPRVHLDDGAPPDPPRDPVARPRRRARAPARRTRRSTHWLEPVFEEAEHVLHPEKHPYELFGIDGALIISSVAIAAVGLAIGIWIFGFFRAQGKRSIAERVPALNGLTQFAYRGSLNKWWFDDLNHLLFIVIGGRIATAMWWFDRTIVDGTVNGIGRLTVGAGSGLRKVQTGRVQNYALGIAFGLLVVAGSYLFIASR